MQFKNFTYHLASIFEPTVQYLFLFFWGRGVKTMEKINECPKHRIFKLKKKTMVSISGVARINGWGVAGDLRAKPCVYFY